MTRWFFYGTLRHLPLLEAVLGRAPRATAGELVGWRCMSADGATPVLVPDHHGRAVGVVVDDLTEAEAARLAYYEEPFGYERHELTVGGAKAALYLPGTRIVSGAGPWDFGAWLADAGEMTLIAARRYMATFPNLTPAEARLNYPMILQRAASSVRAASEPAPATVRGDPGEVIADSTREPYLNFFGVREAALRFRKFDGTMSGPIHRAGFLMGDAVTVLPYDPKRDRVMVVEQFRYGPWVRGDRNPWTLEPIAGRIDPGETPEEAARREAVEEAHLTLGDLILVAQYYPSPGGISEYLYSYIALCDLPDDCARIGGLEDESEDIRAHLLDFGALMALVATPEASNGPLVLTAHALAGMRSRLAP